MLMKAMAMALCQVPDANVQFGGDVLHRFSRVDISMAVAIEGGLVTPVIRGVDTLSLSAIAQQAKELASKARDGRLTPEDYRGGTCSLRSEEHTSELQSIMRISYAVFCLKKKTKHN